MLSGSCLWIVCMGCLLIYSLSSLWCLIREVFFGEFLSEIPVYGWCLCLFKRSPIFLKKFPPVLVFYIFMRSAVTWPPDLITVSSSYSVNSFLCSEPLTSCPVLYGDSNPGVRITAH